ncbi:MAG: peptidase [Rhodospirillales bacterium]|jgi:zinc protease|nr:peptidase [Rhodospirillales bacterium]
MIFVRCLTLVLLGGLTLAAPASADTTGDQPSSRFGAEGFMLSNGMQVVVIPNHRAPVVTQMVWYKAGGADEQRGKSGIAHFLEHLMFKGTKDVAPGMFSRIVAQNGGRDNAFTGEDYTAYYQTVAIDRLPLIMKLESDRMANLQLKDEVVLPERKVILEERRMRIDNSPAALLDEQTRTAIYLHHPYRIPTIGWEHEMEGLTTADALAWYGTWYAPNNAILVVSGDIDVAQLKPLAEQYYGVIPARPVPERVRVSEPPRVATARLEFRSPQVAQANWTRSYQAPSYTGGETAQAYPLQVLSQILGGGETSILYRSLVLKQQLALGAGSFYDPGARDITTFGFYASPRPGVTVAQLETAMEAEIQKLLTEGVSAEDVARAKSRMVTAAVYARDSLSGPANIFGAALANGRTIEDVEQWPDRVAQVTVAEVDAAAHQVIHEKEAVTSILLPDPTSLAAAGPAAAPVAPSPGETLRVRDDDGQAVGSPGPGILGEIR